MRGQESPSADGKHVKAGPKAGTSKPGQWQACQSRANGRHVKAGPMAGPMARSNGTGGPTAGHNAMSQWQVSMAVQWQVTEQARDWQVTGGPMVDP